MNKKKMFLIIGGIIITIVVFLILLLTIIIPNTKYNKFKKYIQNNNDYEKINNNVYKNTKLKQYDIKYDFNKNTYTRINSQDNLTTKVVVEILKKRATLYLYGGGAYNENNKYFCTIVMDYNGDELTYDISQNKECQDILKQAEIVSLKEQLLFETNLTIYYVIEDVYNSKSNLYNNCKYCQEKNN